MSLCTDQTDQTDQTEKCLFEFLVNFFIILAILAYFSCFFFLLEFVRPPKKNPIYAFWKFSEKSKSKSRSLDIFFGCTCR